MTRTVGESSLPRRRFIASAVAVCAGLGLSPAGFAAAMPPSNRLAFEVRRKGRRLGEHRVAFRTDGDRLIVDIDVDFQVRMGFVTVFRFTHRNTETWKGNRLLTVDSETNDDGNRYRVTARDTGDRLWVDGSAGAYLAPPDTMSNSYWNPRTVRSSRILDTQRGGLLQVDTAWLGEEAVTAAGRPVAAEHYRVTGDLRMDIWYSEEGQWVKLDYFARGTTINYGLI